MQKWSLFVVVQMQVVLNASFFHPPNRSKCTQLTHMQTLHHAHINSTHKGGKTVAYFGLLLSTGYQGIQHIQLLFNYYLQLRRLSYINTWKSASLWLIFLAFYFDSAFSFQNNEKILTYLFTLGLITIALFFHRNNLRYLLFQILEFFEKKVSVFSKQFTAHKNKARCDCNAN